VQFIFPYEKGMKGKYQLVVESKRWKNIPITKIQFSPVFSEPSRDI